MADDWWDLGDFNLGGTQAGGGEGGGNWWDPGSWNLGGGGDQSQNWWDPGAAGSNWWGGFDLGEWGQAAGGGWDMTNQAPAPETATPTASTSTDVERPPPQDQPTPEIPGAEMPTPATAEVERPPPQDVAAPPPAVPGTPVAEALAPAGAEPPAGDPSEQLYQYYLRNARAQAPPGASPYELALQRVIAAREGYGNQPANPNPALRDVDHALTANILKREPRFGPLAAGVNFAAPPVYEGLKFLAQNTPPVSGIPQGLDTLMQGLGGGRGAMTQASPPSWQALKWGWRPFWARD